MKIKSSCIGLALLSFFISLEAMQAPNLKTVNGPAAPLKVLSCLAYANTAPLALTKLPSELKQYAFFIAQNQDRLTGLSAKKLLFDSIKDGILDSNLLSYLLNLDPHLTINVQNKEGKTPLMVAASHGHTSTVQLLLDQGASTDLQDKRGFTALIHAALNGYFKTAELLVVRGADLDVMDLEGDTALEWAASRGYQAIVKLLLERGAQSAHANNEGLTPFASALRHNQIKTALAFAKQDAKNIVDIPDNKGRTPLVYHAQEGDTFIVRTLLELGAKPDSRDPKGKTALIHAAAQGYTSTVIALVNKGADVVNLRDNKGRTALVWATRKGHDKVVGYLLEHGAQVDLGDNKGRTPLVYAAKREHGTVARLLLAAGAQVDLADNAGKTALIHATKQRAYQYPAEDQAQPDNNSENNIFTVLLEQGAQINHQDNAGRTALAWATRVYNQELVESFIERGAQVDLPDNSGRTPLMQAAADGCDFLVDLLLHHGAQLDRKDPRGRTALTYAHNNWQLQTACTLLGKCPTWSNLYLKMLYSPMLYPRTFGTAVKLAATGAFVYWTFPQLKDIFYKRPHYVIPAILGTSWILSRGPINCWGTLRLRA